MASTERRMNILLVEDSIEDVELTKLAFKRIKYPHSITVAKDGQECMEWLEDCLTDTNKRLPDLILLDLNMPKKGGKEVLEEIKTDENLRTIPVIVLTTSEAKDDVIDSYSRHANGYISKPIDFRRFGEVVSVIEDFWFKQVSLPRGL